MICRKCRNKAGRYVVDDNEPVFLLTLEDKAALAAWEMVKEANDDLITAEDIADTMPPQPWEA